MAGGDKGTSLAEIRPLTSVAPQAIEALLDRAFGRERKTKTAYRLREGAHAIPALSFAAWDGDVLLGTLQSWPVALDDAPLVMVGPVAVDPEAQGKGVGKLLMETLLAEAGERPLMMIGDPDYYGRFFGFTAEHTGGWRAPGPVDPARLLARGEGLPERGMLRAVALTV